MLVITKSWDSSPWLADSKVDTLNHLDVKLHKVYTIKSNTIKGSGLMFGLRVLGPKKRKKQNCYRMHVQIKQTKLTLRKSKIFTPRTRTANAHLHVFQERIGKM